MDAACVTCLLLLLLPITSSTDDESDRAGRSWHHPSLFAGPAVPSTSQPASSTAADAAEGGDPHHDKMGVAPSDLDYVAMRQFNVHRFDPSFINNYFYERQAHPRYPNLVQQQQQQQGAGRFGPGYRQDKYGHGYGYSCKQGDDCDEVVKARHPPPPAAFNNHFPLPFPPSPGSSPFGPPARFHDPHSLSSMMPPPPIRYGRYLHEEQETTQ